MIKFAVTLAAGALVLASPASANHFLNPGPYDSRGDCESAKADYSSDDREGLLERFPNFFSSTGEVTSFLTRAFVCEIGTDGLWYLEDYRQEVVDSEWFQRRLR
jgi:hypothetical protein